MKLLKKIFEAYGEYELAEDEDALQDMVDCACHVKEDGTKSQKDPMFNLKSFARGLTSDVRLYDVYNEVRKTTYYDDVMESDKLGHIINRNSVRKNSDGNIIEDDDNKKGDDILKQKLKAIKDGSEKFELEQLYTGPSMDSATGSYRSKYLNVFLWVGCKCVTLLYGMRFDFVKSSTDFVFGWLGGLVVVSPSWR